MSRSIKTFSDGEIIFREGERGGDAYAISKGLIALSKDTARGPVEIEVLAAGAPFGEVGVMNGGKRTLTATAVGDVRLEIIDASGDEAARSRTSHKSAMTGSSNGEPAQQEKSEKPSPRGLGKLADQRWWSRLLHPDGRASSKIEIRIVPFSGEQGAACAKLVQEALKHCADIKVRMVNREGPFAQKNGIAKNHIGVCVGAARKILNNTTGDLLIWGEVAPPGTTMHLHFVSALANDEDLSGAFNGYDVLPLPMDLDESWIALLHSIVLAATAPFSVAKANTINTHIEPAIEAGASAVQNPPRDFQAIERAHLLISHAHSISAIAQRLNEHDLLSFAADTYTRALQLVTEDDSPVLWGMAHKHLGFIQMVIAERLGDPSAYLEARKSLQVAVDVIPRRRLPREWAAAQNKLGLVYYKLDYGDPSFDASLLSSAIAAFQSATQVYTPVDAPERWAEVMNNYALAAQVLGQQLQDPDMLQKAVAACRNALEVRRRSRTPLLWAATQNTLGSALFLLAKHSGRADHLESAIDAFRAAHTVYAGKSARKMTRVIARNLEHVQTLLEKYRAEQARRVHWFDEGQKIVPTTNALPSERERQWWKDNVVDKPSVLSEQPVGEYRHPSGDMDIPLYEKLSNSSRS